MPALWRIVAVTVALILMGVPATAETLSFSEYKEVELPKGEFRAADNPDALRDEKIQGQPDFVRVKDLSESDPNLALSRKVGQLVGIGKNGGGAAFCSGSLVGHDLFLTNQHCVAGDHMKQFKGLAVAMENLHGLNRMPKGSVAKVRDIVKSDRYLDFALLQISPPIGLEYGWLDLARDTDTIRRAKAVKIIQHPEGRPKEIVLDNTEIVRHVGKFMHYVADTQGGSSGSPVFARDGETVIGLHHAGNKRFNEAARIDVIAEMLSSYLPDPKTSQTTEDDPEARAADRESTESSGGAVTGGDGGGMQAITE